MRRRSNIALILGIVGSLLLFPAMLYTAFIGAIIGLLTGHTGAFGAHVGYAIGIVNILLALLGAILSKSKNILAGFLLLLATLGAFFGLVLTAFVSALHWAIVIILFISALFSFINN